MPFSFAESYEYATAIGRNISPDEFMIDYINWGGFPLRFRLQKKVILRDIWSRHMKVS